MSATSINNHIHTAVDRLPAQSRFSANDLKIKNGKAACNSRKVSSILKSRIRCPENPKGDLRYDNGTWMKLEPVNA